MSEKLSVFDKPITRRDVLRGAGLLGLGAVVAGVGFRPSDALAAPEVQPLLQGGADLPIVEGEPTFSGEVVLPEAGILRIDQQMNSRDTNTTVGSSRTSREPHTYIEVTPGEEDMEDATEGESLRWTGGDLIFEPEKGVVADPAEREHVYVANTLGITTLITEGTVLPVEIQELYKTQGELPISFAEIDVQELPSIFSQTGGTETFQHEVAQAWGLSVGSRKNLGEQATESPLIAWQFAMSMAATPDLEDPSKNGSVNICSIMNRPGECNYYRHVRDANSTDVIGRYSNLNDPKNSDIFSIVRFETDDKGQQKVTSVGFVSPEGFQNAYGAQATEIASSVTAMTGESVPELLDSINPLEQTQVFLAGLDVFAPRIDISTERGAVHVGYQRMVERPVPAYAATTYDENGNILSKYTAISNDEGLVNWMKSVETVEDLSEEAQKILKKQLADFSQAMMIDIDSVQIDFLSLEDVHGQAITVALGRSESGINSNFTDMYSNVPLLIGSQNLEGGWNWQKATLTNVFKTIDKKVGVNMDKDYALSTNHRATIGENFSEVTITQGALLWQWAESEQGFYQDWAAKDMQKLIKAAENFAEKKGITAQHMLFPAQFPDWLKMGNFEFKQGETEQQAYTRVLQDRIKYLAENYGQDIRRWAVVNEPFFDGGTIGENWVRDDIFYRKLGSDYIEIAFRQARESLGEDAVLIYNDVVNQALNDRNNGLYSQLTIANLQRLQGLVDIAGMQMHIDGSKPPTKAQVIAAMQEYAKYTTRGVEITEMDVDLTGVSAQDKLLLQAQIYKEMVVAALESGVCAGISFWDVGDSNSWLEKYMEKPQADATLFTDNLQPKPAYYAILQAGLEQLRST